MLNSIQIISNRKFQLEWGQSQTDATKLTTRDIPNQLTSVGNIDHPSPRPHRKLHPFKSAPKKYSQGNNTPPDSPTLAGSGAFTRKFK